MRHALPTRTRAATRRTRRCISRRPTAARFLRPVTRAANFEGIRAALGLDSEPKKRHDMDAPRDGALRAGTGARESPENTPSREHRPKPLSVSHGRRCCSCDHRPPRWTGREEGWPTVAGTSWRQSPAGRISALSSAELTGECQQAVVRGRRAKRRRQCAQDLFGDRYEATTSIGGRQEREAFGLGARTGDARSTIWADADATGAKHTDEVARLCHEVGATAVLRVRTDDLPDGWDLADPIPDGLDSRGEACRGGSRVPPPPVATGQLHGLR